MSQIPKFPKARKHKAKPAITPTWPRTTDQRKQSRPVIVLRPIRALTLAMLASNPPDKDGVRSLTRNQEDTLRMLATAPRPVISLWLADYR